MHEFQEKVGRNYNAYSFTTLNTLLRFETKQLALMKDIHIVDEFDTSKNVEKALSNALCLLTALANKEGLTLHDLLTDSV